MRPETSALPSLAAKAFPLVLRELRREVWAALTVQGLSMSGLARTLGISRNTLHKWLHGEDHVQVYTILKLAEWVKEQR